MLKRPRQNLASSSLPRDGQQPTRRHRIITGSAGSGKTTLMRNEAAEFMRQDDTRLLVIASSEYAAEPLRSLPGAQSGRHLIASARGLCLSLLPPELHTVDEEILGITLNHLPPDGPVVRDEFSHILVDDAHNLSPAMIRLIERLAVPNATITYYIDPAQAIFSFAGATGDTLALIRAYAGPNVMRLRLRHRPVPVINPEIVEVTPEDIADKAVGFAWQLLKDGDSVAILTRTNAEAELTVAKLEEAEIPHVRLSARLLSASSPRRESDMIEVTRDKVTVSTVHTFRDRTALHTIVYDTALRRPTDDLAAERRRVATGCCRAIRSATVIRLADADRYI